MTLSDDDILSVMFRAETLGQTYGQVALTVGTTRSAVAGIIKRLRDARVQVEAAGLTDLQVKRMLDRMFFGRNLAESIAKDFARGGVALTRQAVLYQVWWVMNDLHAAGPDHVQIHANAEVPTNAEVIDWPQWWRRAQIGEVAA